MVKRFRFVPIVVVAITFFGWELLVRSFGVSRLILPPPSHIFYSIFQSPGTLLSDTMITLHEALFGFFIALVFGGTISILATSNRTFAEAVSPLMSAWRSMPVIALAPALVMALGLGTLPKVLIAAIVATPALSLGVLEGLRQAPRELIDIAKVHGGKRFTEFLHVRIPHARHAIRGATKLCFALALLGAAVGEWAGSSQGLGYRMLRAQKDLETAVVWGNVFTLGLLGVLGSRLIGGLFLLWEHRLKTTRYMSTTVTTTVLGKAKNV